MTNTLARRNDTALSLEDRIEAIKEATNEHHANALSAARSAFQARVTQAVAFCADQALDAITAS
jgi:hypothetical protein